LGGYWDEHDEIVTDADARGPSHLHIDEAATPDERVAEFITRAWHVRQTIVDPAGDHDWVIEAVVDLDASDSVGELVLLTTGVRRL
jgi:hypothetical protein